MTRSSPLSSKFDNLFARKLRDKILKKKEIFFFFFFLNKITSKSRIVFQNIFVFDAFLFLFRQHCIFAFLFFFFYFWQFYFWFLISFFFSFFFSIFFLLFLHPIRLHKMCTCIACLVFLSLCILYRLSRKSGSCWITRPDKQLYDRFTHQQFVKIPLLKIRKLGIFKFEETK